MDSALSSFELLHHCFTFLPVKDTAARRSVVEEAQEVEGHQAEERQEGAAAQSEFAGRRLCVAASVCKFWHAVVQGSAGTLWRSACATEWAERSGHVTAELAALGGSVKDTVSWTEWCNILRRGCKHPTCIDPSPHGAYARELVLDVDDPCKVQWRGQSIGGDRAVRTEHPFPAVGAASSTHNKQQWEPDRARFLPFATVRAVRGAPHGSMATAELCMMGYFEVHILSLPSEEAGSHAEQGMCSVGLGTRSFRLKRKQPGWTGDSFGYHGDDGNKFHAGGLGRGFGPCFGPGDIIGCGINYHTNEIFFTKNGAMIGVAFVCNLREPLYPVVGIDTWNPVMLNLGLDRPFAFDIAAYEVEAWQGAATREGEAHLSMRSLVDRVLAFKSPQHSDEGSTSRGGLLWEQTRSELLEALQILGEMHCEWAGNRLALIPGPPPTGEEGLSLQTALYSEQAAEHFAAGVGFMQQQNRLLLVPTPQSNVETDSEEDPVFGESDNDDDDDDELLEASDDEGVGEDMEEALEMAMELLDEGYGSDSDHGLGMDEESE